MRIMSPPKFIMNISLIMRLIIALIVFQCTPDLGPAQLCDNRRHQKEAEGESERERGGSSALLAAAPLS